MSIVSETMEKCLLLVPKLTQVSKEVIYPSMKTIKSDMGFVHYLLPVNFLQVYICNSNFRYDKFTKMLANHI